MPQKFEKKWEIFSSFVAFSNVLTLLDIYSFENVMNIGKIQDFHFRMLEV